MNDYVDPPQDDDTPGGLNPIACAAGVFVLEIALALIWVFRASIWSGA